VDEIQSGIGRTGRFFAFEDYNFKPDLVATSKALGGGLPLGAFIVSENLVHVFSAGEHGTTFGGNPLACAAGLATVEIISDPDFLLGVQRLSNMFVSMLYDLREEYDDVIVDIRGKGLMLGLELRDKAEEVKNHALQNGLIINLTAGNTIRFVPPLTITKEHIDEAYEKLRTVFRQVFRSNS
jgi:acetylornithine/N-succinyldiaminopimelate aminotransferase